jgi:hypothetical protein
VKEERLELSFIVEHIAFQLVDESQIFSRRSTLIQDAIKTCRNLSSNFIHVLIREKMCDHMREPLPYIKFSLHYTISP